MLAKNLVSAVMIASLALTLPALGSSIQQTSEVEGGVRHELSTMTLTNSTPLTARSIGGVDFKVPFLKSLSVIDLKKQIAEQWNTNFKTNWTEKNIWLFGPGAFVGRPEKTSVNYHNDDKLSLDAIHKDYDKIIYLSIHAEGENPE